MTYTELRHLYGEARRTLLLKGKTPDELDTLIINIDDFNSVIMNSTARQCLDVAMVFNSTKPTMMGLDLYVVRRKMDKPRFLCSVDANDG